MKNRKLNKPIIIETNGKKYRIVELTTVCFGIKESKSCIAYFEYKGKWYPVKNFQILHELRKNFDDIYGGKEDEA